MTSETSNSEIKRILLETKTIAVVGISTNPVRASFFVVRYLHYRGYNIIPINPAYEGQIIFGQKILANLSDIPDDTKIDMVNIFRRSEFVPQIVDEALTHLMPHLRTIWMQFGIFHEEAAAKARAHGLRTVEDRCPKIEYQRLFGELRKAGINTGIISSKLPEVQ
jgi:hypothetical protein